MMKLTNIRLEPHFSRELQKHAMVKMLTAFAFYRQKDRHACPKTVRDAYRVPNTGSARQAPAQCQVQQSRSYGNASANPLISCYRELKIKMRSKNGPKSFFGVCQSVSFSWHSRHGPHFGSRFGVYKGFVLTMLAQCVSSFFRLTTLILLPKCLLGDLWFLFCHKSSA